MNVAMIITWFSYLIEDYKNITGNYVTQSNQYCINGKQVNTEKENLIKTNYLIYKIK